MSKKALENQILNKVTKVKKLDVPPINKKVARYLANFTANHDILTAAIVQNPFSTNRDVKQIKLMFGSSVFNLIKSLNGIKKNEKKFLDQYEKHKELILLFLSNYKILNQEPIQKSKLKNCFSSQSLKYASELLKKTSVSEIRTDLEDVFFSRLEPQIYNHYKDLLKFTRKKFLHRQNEMIAEFSKILKDNHLDSDSSIKARIKTIYSIHNKIINKNILFTQVLDTIGIRILLPNEDQCYKMMVLILKNKDFVMSKIKDYIAIPKGNGYQSIHLTIIHKGFPVEIQIRTYEMHRNAQYGKASHKQYKQSSNA